MASVYDSEQLNQARTQAQSSAQAAASAETAGMTLPDMLRDALNKKFSIDNPLVQGREQAASRYLTETTQAPLDYTARSAGGRSDVIYSPLEQNNLIQGRRAAALAPLTSANYLLDLSRGGIDDIIDATTRSYGAYTKNLSNRASLDRQMYADLFGEAQARADEAYKYASLNKGTASSNQSAKLKSIANDAKAGLTLKSIMQKYGTEADLSPDDILRVYNTNSRYGPAKESAEVLQKLFGVTPTGTAEQRNRVNALQPAIKALGGISANELKLGGPANRGAQVSLNFFGGTGVDPKLAGLNQKYELMRQNVVRALQGARMSDKDIQIAQGYIPSILDTPEIAKVKIDNLKTFLNDLGSGATIDTSSGGGSDWEVIQ